MLVALEAPQRWLGDYGYRQGLPDPGGITDERHGAPIVRAIISMAKSLNQRIVAEGIETAEQLTFLRAQQCSEGQGYYFGQPLPADQFVKVLATSARAFVKV